MHVFPEIQFQISLLNIALLGAEGNQAAELEKLIDQNVNTEKD